MDDRTPSGDVGHDEMGTDFLLRNVRRAGASSLANVRVIDGRIEAIEPADADDVDDGPDALPTIDGDGGLLMPPLVDAHLHLDLAYTLDEVGANERGTLLEAIRLWDIAKRGFSPEEVAARATRAIHELAAYGTTIIRSHVDVGSSAGLRLVEGVLEARSQTNHLVDIELVAFPQDGILRDAGALERMRQSIERGVDLVGGIPHVERTHHDSRVHIAKMLELARELDVDVDVHIDETDAPESRCTEELAAETMRVGYEGRVTASHVCALASYSDAHAYKVVQLIKDAAISVVTNPQVNLHLQGRYETYPKRRGLTRVRELLKAGVLVAAGQDCIRDPFYPLGTGNMVDVAHTLVHADHLAGPRDLLRAMACVSENPATILGVDNYGIAAGCDASFVLFATPDVHETIRRRPLPRCVWRQGKVIARDGRLV